MMGFTKKERIIFYTGVLSVIVGIVFKILHLKGANFMLIFGLASQALIFLIHAFSDRENE